MRLRGEVTPLPPGAGVPAGRPLSSAIRSLYVLGLLSLISLISYYDRFVVAILAQNIKRDLHLTDSQLGLLTGLGFAVIYSGLAIPIARFSDRGRRVGVLAASLTLWSAMTALCGLAPNFLGLLLARMGVGVGEAGANPTTHALVAEYFSPRWRAMALSIIVVMGGVGFMAANAAGGWLADHYSWRMAFLVGAAPGPFLALLLLLTVREPVRPPEPKTAADNALGPAIRALMSRRALLLTCLGAGVCSMASAAVSSWAPAFLMREHNLTAGGVGVSYGAVMGVSTIFGLILGGWLGDTLPRRDGRWALWLPALAFGLTLPLTAAFLFATDFKTAVALAAPMTVVGMLGNCPLYALVQTLSGSRLRATGAALYLLAVNLLGTGLGPTLAGWLSDGLHSLRWALALVALAYPLGAVLLASGASAIAEDSLAADR
ncbi:MAG: MFS transporter [Pseudomonadota bacterium]|uniref:spinster family MFS transporter n=1 Tax=Phenylobacterium sp. TaxID=1871053 RepID=UPI0025DCD999|nr:MFS transporter [Phenylobacterium sp.]MBT9472707.1 MFS transporter [Phenylobacterium sp.]